MTALKSALDRGLGWALGLLLTAMVGNVLWQVFSRFVLGVPSSFTEELARYLMIWLGLLGGAYGVGRQSHLALDLLTQRLRGGARRAAEGFILLALLAFALGVLVYGGGRLVWITLTLGQTSAALQWKLGYVYLSLPVAGVIIALYCLLALAAARRDETAGAQRSSALN